MRKLGGCGIEREDADFFALLLAQPYVAAALFRERLPPRLFAQLADVPPRLVTAEGVQPGVVVFDLALLGGRELFVCCILETQAPESAIALRTLDIVAATWRWVAQSARRSAPLPVILPLIVYCGATRWKAPHPSAKGGGVASPGAEPGGLEVDAVVVDVGAIDDAELSEQPTLRVGLCALKHGRGVSAREALREEMQRLPSEQLELFAPYLRKRGVRLQVGRMASALRTPALELASDRWLSRIAR